MVALGSVVDGDSVAAGGYLVQLLPEAAEAEASVETMSERLADFVDIRDRLSDSPEALVEQIFDGMPFTWLHESEVRFGCQCSQLRVMTTLSLLERSEIQELVDEGEPLSIGRDYCGASYTVEIAQLQGLLSAS
jgi:molecular chaperone Hsp33